MAAAYAAGRVRRGLPPRGAIVWDVTLLLTALGVGAALGARQAAETGQDRLMHQRELTVSALVAERRAAELAGDAVLLAESCLADLSTHMGQACVCWDPVTP